MPDNRDEQEIRNLVAQFVEGWNAGDGHMCARPFAENAEFTAVTGQHVRGRDFIARGHAEILSTVFRGTHNSATVNEISFLRSDVAVADVTFRLDPVADKPWLPRYSTCGVVATKDDGRWSIAAFRNMVPFDRPVAGPLDKQTRDVAQAAFEQEPAVQA